MNDKKNQEDILNNIKLLRQSINKTVAEFGAMLGMQPKQTWDLETHVGIKYNLLKKLHELGFNLNFLVDSSENIYRKKELTKDTTLQEIYFKLENYFEKVDEKEKERIKNIIDLSTVKQ